MQIGPMTAEEWALDVHKVMRLSENPVAILQALVERIHMETVQQCAGHAATAGLVQVQAAVDKARAERLAARKEKVW
jgi:uncharacterized small protein (DUF1192 family)